MNFIKYFLNKSYRGKINNEYTELVCNKIISEEKQLEEIYAFSLNNIRETHKTSA